MYVLNHYYSFSAVFIDDNTTATNINDNNKTYVLNYYYLLIMDINQVE